MWVFICAFPHSSLFLTGARASLIPWLNAAPSIADNDGQNVSSYPSPKRVIVSFKSLLANHKMPFKDLMLGWLKMVEKTLCASRQFKRYKTSTARYDLELDFAGVAYKKSPMVRVAVVYWVAGLVMRRVRYTLCSPSYSCLSILRNNMLSMIIKSLSF